MCSDFDKYDKLRHAAWETFDARRGYEWKMCFGVWAGLIALIGFSSGDHPLSVPCFVPFAVAVLVPCLHAWYQANIARVNQIDLDRMHEMEQLMLSKANRCYTENFEARLAVHWMLKRWSHISFVTLTIILSTLSAVLLKSGLPSWCGVFYFLLGFGAALGAANRVITWGKLTNEKDVTKEIQPPTEASESGGSCNG